MITPQRVAEDVLRRHSTVNHSARARAAVCQCRSVLIVHFAFRTRQGLQTSCRLRYRGRNTQERNIEVARESFRQWIPLVTRLYRWRNRTKTWPRLLQKGWRRGILREDIICTTTTCVWRSSSSQNEIFDALGRTTSRTSEQNRWLLQRGWGLVAATRHQAQDAWATQFITISTDSAFTICERRSIKWFFTETCVREARLASGEVITYRPPPPALARRLRLRVVVNYAQSTARLTFPAARCRALVPRALGRRRLPADCAGAKTTNETKIIRRTPLRQWLQKLIQEWKFGKVTWQSWRGSRGASARLLSSQGEAWKFGQGSYASKATGPRWA